MEVVAADLAPDGRAVSAELMGDDGDRRLRAEQAEDRAALGEVELAVGAEHGATPSGKCLKTLQSRTSR